MDSMRGRYGEWAIVTGASLGIGAAFANRLAAEGMNLVLVARCEDALDRLKVTLGSKYGVKIICLPVDLSQDGCLQPLIAVCSDLEIGLVVNNAGTGNPGILSSCEIEKEMDVIRLNCLTPLEITHHFLPAMQRRGKGGIILVSSLMGFQGVPYMANYSATKGYLLNLGEALYHECKASGVDVLVLAPGATETPGKYLHEVDYSKLPISWMSAEGVVDAALKKIGKKAFVIPGFRNYMMACLSGGLWSRGWVQGIMLKLAKIVLPV
ncbi:MAG: SDR family NAD(P)-dependent oxidoreductase [Planctomycetaceae bacterium]|nr:SDR family NAD(P)-dependent oxidoreductase [Planctomycetaceae bacterium]